MNEQGKDAMNKKERVWVQVSSGRGPLECRWVCRKIALLLVDELKKEFGDELELALYPEEGGHKEAFLSALIQVNAGASCLKELMRFFKRWEGSVLWSGQSPFRPHHKRKNWFVQVAFWSAPGETEERALLRDIEIETMRASGPGGQHVNKTESAVRAVHIPTGISVVAREERSQQMNRRLAIARIAALLREESLKRQAMQKQDNWRNHNRLVRGNPVRSFRGADFKEV